MVPLHIAGGNVNVLSIILRTRKLIIGIKHSEKSISGFLKVRRWHMMKNICLTFSTEVNLKIPFGGFEKYPYFCTRKIFAARSSRG